MAASRFPGKPLAPIAGLPMIEHVRRRVALSDAVDDVVVATCDEEILRTVQAAGGKAVMTAATHERCTDRIAEAAESVPCDVAVIVQGDEPLFMPDILADLVAPFRRDPGTRVVNLVSRIEDPADLGHVDVVKAVLNEAGDVMYFSRAPIPHVRVRAECPMYRQTGVSAFSRDALAEFPRLPPTALEIAESVDFLRIVGHGGRIRAVVFDQPTVGVDRPEDVARVEAILRDDAVQAAVHRKIAA
jgi:3-deoxy-manno-octulosonate cytidylyltransferase (CMP-KDO synthetase)